ncbi:DUF6035 family protein [Alteromonas oceani]|uniref:DUF6035 family protein n=1 Tax=Alteromonas oceani TaxID=2071609 RepID=A0ABV7K2N5_9ALTE
MSKIISVIRNASGEEISAQAVLEGNEKKFSFERMLDAHHRRDTGGYAYSCSLCEQPLSIKLSSNGNRFFSHNPQSNDCDWKIEDGGPNIPNSLTDSEGRLHRYYKAMIQLSLSRTDGVKDIKSEKRVYIAHSRERYRYPDVQCSFQGINIAFEVQVSSLSPEMIVSRERDYESIGWKLIWLLPKDKRFITQFDIINNPSSVAFFCSLNTQLLERWEVDRAISFQCPIWKPSLNYKKVQDDSEYHAFDLVDVISSMSEDDGYLRPGDFQFPKGSLKYITETGTENLMLALARPDEYRSLSNQTKQDAALDDYFINQLKFTKNLKNALRVIGSIKVGKSLWEVEGDLDRVLIIKFYPRILDNDESLSNKYGDFVAVAIAAAFTYQPELLKTPIFEKLISDFLVDERFEDIESPIGQIKGRGSKYLLSMFPRFSDFWDDSFLRDYLRE